jgi:hypothetical protein
LISVDAKAATSKNICYFLTDAQTSRGTGGAPVVVRSPSANPLLPWELLGVHSACMDIFASTASNVTGRLNTGQLNGKASNSQLASNSITIGASAGLSGGGAGAPDGATALINTGVLSASGNKDRP